MSDTGTSKTAPRGVVIVCSTVCILAVLGTYLIMELNGKSTGTLLPLIMGLVTAAGSTAAWNSSKDAKKDTAEIKKQTNGPLSDMSSVIQGYESRFVNIETSLGNIDRRLQERGI